MGLKGKAQDLTPRLVLALGLVAGQEIAPDVRHQPALCTVPDRAIRVCAKIEDADGSIAKARVFFRPEGERHFSFVEMWDEGERYCATLPGPRAKAKGFDYYLQAIDDTFVPQRTSPFLLELREEGACDFPPLEPDPARAAAITVYATQAEQGGSLHADLNDRGVTFVAKRRGRRR